MSPVNIFRAFVFFLSLIFFSVSTSTVSAQTPSTKDLLLSWLSSTFDRNGDSKVNSLDFAILIGTSTPTSTPSPTPTPPSGSAVFQPFGTVNISTTNFNVNGAGSNVDSIDFWEAPDPTQSLMFVTSKNTNRVEVWRYPFNVANSPATIEANACMTTVGTNGVAVDQETDKLYITTSYGNKICVFNLPSLTLSATITTPATSSWLEPNLALLKLSDGQKRLYISYDTRVYIYNPDTGANLGQFTPTKGLETMFGDNYYQQLYIPDENGRTGIYSYTPTGQSISSFGNGVFNSDEEGIWVYSCPSSGIGDNGEGFIIVSDQISALTEFEVFNRKTKQHLGKLTITGVNNTDGISITQQSSPAYPLGLFAAIDDDTSAVGVKWETIFSAIRATGANFTCGS